MDCATSLQWARKMCQVRTSTFIRFSYKLALGGILFGEDGDYPSEAPIIADQEEVIHGILTRAFKINVTTGNMEYAVQVYHEFGSQQIGAKDCKRQAANTICQLLCIDKQAPLATLRDTKVHVEKTWNLLDGLAHLRAISKEPTIYDYELKEDFQLVMELYKESQEESQDGWQIVK